MSIRAYLHQGITRNKLRAWNPDTAATITDQAADDLLSASILRITEQFLLHPDPRWPCSAPSSSRRRAAATTTIRI